MMNCSIFNDIGNSSTSQCVVSPKGFDSVFDRGHMASHISEKIRLARIQTFGPILLQKAKLKRMMVMEEISFCR